MRLARRDFGSHSQFSFINKSAFKTWVISLLTYKFSVFTFRGASINKREFRIRAFAFEYRTLLVITIYFRMQNIRFLYTELQKKEMDVTLEFCKITTTRGQHDAWLFRVRSNLNSAYQPAHNKCFDLLYLLTRNIRFLYTEYEEEMDVTFKFCRITS